MQAEYTGGAVIVAYGADIPIVDQSFGQNPDTVADSITTNSNTSFPPGPLPTDAPDASPAPTIAVASPTPGAAMSPPVGLKAIVRGAGGVPISFTATSDSPADLQAQLTAWLATPSVLNGGATPPPAPSKAWTLIGERQTFNNPSIPNWYQDQTQTVGSVGIDTKVYRLSTNDPATDYVMTVSTLSTTPQYVKVFGNACHLNCGYFTWARTQTLNVACGPNESTAAATADLGPLNQVQVSRITWNVGATLTGKIGFGGKDKGANAEGNAGLSVGYSQSWDQQMATTLLTSTLGDTTATWQDTTSNFMSGATWDFGAYNITTTVANFTNGKVAIFKCPRGSLVRPFVNAPVFFRAAALYPFGIVRYDEKELNNSTGGDIAMPTFGIDTAALSLAPGTGKTFRIQVKSSPLEVPKAWVVVPDPNDTKLLITPSSGTDSSDGPGSLYQNVSVFAQTSAVPGNRYTLYVNTVPAGGADTLRNGSLLLTVSIVSP